MPRSLSVAPSAQPQPEHGQPDRRQVSNRLGRHQRDAGQFFCRGRDANVERGEAKRHHGDRDHARQTSPQPGRAPRAMRLSAASSQPWTVKRNSSSSTSGAITIAIMPPIRMARRLSLFSNRRPSGCSVLTSSCAAGRDRVALPPCSARPLGERGQAPFAGTARRVLRTNGACPLFPRLPRRPPGTTGSTLARPAPAARRRRPVPAGRSAPRQGTGRRGS